MFVTTWLTQAAYEFADQAPGEMPVRRASPDGSATGFEGAFEGRSIFRRVADTKNRSKFLPFFFEVCIVGSAFSMAQGLITSAILPVVTSKMKLKLLSLRGARVGMERVGHTATTIATSLLKSTQVTDPVRVRDLIINRIEYEARQKILQRRVFRCEEAALRLTRMHPITQYDGLPQPSSQPRLVSQFPLENNMNSEKTHFFETFSLEMEMEFRTSNSKNKPPSLTAQRAITKIRMILENLIDEDQLDAFRSPIVRENIDVMAISGRECLVYSYKDAVPIAFLRVFKGIASVMLFAVPLFINIEWKGMVLSRRLCLCLLIGCVGAAGLTILSEVDCMWKAFDKGMNSYAWSLGIAREIDKLLEEPEDSILHHRYGGELNTSIRKHRYNIGYDEVCPFGQMDSPLPEISSMD
ncbi:unnamed protein product [Fusarium graminearum]|nr:unnamed protein product [Fusarium graminearum]CAF3610815.1 unnamed protein product [Fusarium graminearum]CAG1981150.1 unnamed protein product [Fusarium graminearum]CAG1983268.1 unnamed protein product [Fusarium graminearum]